MIEPLSLIEPLEELEALQKLEPLQKVGPLEKLERGKAARWPLVVTAQVASRRTGRESPP